MTKIESRVATLIARGEIGFTARDDSAQTLKASHRVAGGRARFLRGAPGSQTHTITASPEGA